MSLRRSLLRSRTCRFSFTFSKSTREFKAPDAVDTRSALLAAVAKIDGEDFHGDLWSTMLPEILGDIILRVEAGEGGQTVRRDVVSCACVCKRWRDITKEIVRSPLLCGRITFPSCLKQPGPEDGLLQCLIQRDKKHGTFFLYLAHCPASFTEMGKFLLAARKFKHGARTDYLISLSREDISEGSNGYMGKLSSDLFGTNFTIYDTRPPQSGVMSSACRTSCRRFATKQISPEVSAANFDAGHISYKLNLLKSKGPRRMVCSLKCPQEVASPNTKCLDHVLELRNKAPRWHESMQCWCLNFHGRVTVASVKNFQLAVVTMEGVKVEDEDTLLLQFGKVEDDVFTMDFKRPLSAFQAFAICLTSFGTKLACE